MLFPTIDFTLFAIITILLWWTIGVRTKYLKLGMLVLFNIFFYSYISPSMTLYLIMWSLVLWAGANKLKYFILSLGILQLCFWKGVDAGLLEFDPIKTPLGLSFFTFQGLTYLFGIWKKPVHLDKYHLETEWNPFEIFAFVGFFPTVFSGPILRASTWMQNFKNPECLNKKILSRALALISLGTLYKLCISSILHDYSVEAFANPVDTSALILWTGMYAYTFEIYTDFAGYSLMSMGVALLYGFHIPFNFDRPYMTLNIRDFWSRWHISFSQWLRDYLYISLGGSRVGYIRHYLNILIVMTLCGVWHGFNSAYLTWGILQGVAMIVLQFIQKTKFKMPNSISWILNFHFICISWIFFRSPTASDACTYILGLFTQWQSITDIYDISAVFILFMISMLFQFYETQILNITQTISDKLTNIILKSFFWSSITIMILMLSPSGMPPFIYFSY